MLAMLENPKLFISLTNIYSVRKAAHQEQKENVQWNEIDDEYISSPG